MNIETRLLSVLPQGMVPVFESLLGGLLVAGGDQLFWIRNSLPDPRGLLALARD